MRVTGGELVGRRLQMPKGPSIRPTLEHVRQALFNLVGSRIRGAKVLDLFSGSGALGIEALSRGAAEVTFVDRSFFCIQAIEANLTSLSLDSLRPTPFTLLRTDAITAIRRLSREEVPFDLVLLDPPYGKHLARKSLNALGRYAIVSKSGLVVAEHDKRDPLPPSIQGKEVSLFLQRTERYGDTVLTIYQRQ